jgi:hypothetical protein
MAGVIINKGSYIARSLNGFGLHWTSQVTMDYLQDSTCRFGRTRKGFTSGLAKLASMAYSRDIHGRAAKVHAFDSRGTMGFQSGIGHMAHVLMPGV